MDSYPFQYRFGFSGIGLIFYNIVGNGLAMNSMGVNWRLLSTTCIVKYFGFLFSLSLHTNKITLTMIIVKIVINDFKKNNRFVL